MEDSEGRSPWAGERDLAKQRADSDDASGSQRPGWYPDPDQPTTQRYWEGDKWGRRWGDPQGPGWVLHEGTLRYFDGSKWTDLTAPPYPAVLTTWGIAGAAFLGVLAALFVVWLGAQISPEHIYLPVKFVVKELPR